MRLFSACWQKLHHQYSASMNPSSSADDSMPPVSVGELIKLLDGQDEETQRLKEAERITKEKAAKLAQQVKSRTTAETLTKSLLRHAGNIRAAVNHPKGKSAAPAKFRNACGASMQAFSHLLPAHAHSGYWGHCC